MSRKDLQDDLIRMAGKYLDSIGGKAIVGGPCCIIQMPGSQEMNFYVAVKMLGRRPPKKKMKCPNCGEMTMDIEHQCG